MTVVVLLVVLVSRFISIHRRRTMGRPGPRGFTSTPGNHHHTDPPAEHQWSTSSSDGSTATGAALSGTAPGWFRDPFVRHDQRYWSGSAWTEQIQDHGVVGIDPPPPPRGSSS